ASCNISTLLFFYSAASHQDLRHFPSRRSSDLCFATQVCSHENSSLSIPFGYCMLFTMFGLSLTLSGVRTGQSSGTHSTQSQCERSEENTSELQSPDHLFCSLWL